MSAAVFPALLGLGWDVVRTPQWQTNVQQSVSGKEVRAALWSYPRWQWELKYELLRQGTVHGTAYAEFQQLAGFFNARQGMFDSFLYQDATDNAVTGQAIGAGNGSQKLFQLVRGFGGFIEPVLAPNVVSAIYFNGVLQGSGGYTVSAWGGTSPGVVTFTTAPGAGVVVTADFTFYFPCRFLSDTLDFNNFMALLWAAKSVKFMSLK